MDSAERPSGRRASSSEVITVRESTVVTSIGGVALADTLTAPSSFAAVGSNDTSVPAPTRRLISPRVSTTFPSRSSDTVYVPRGSSLAL